MILTILCLCAVCCGAQTQAKVYQGKWKKNIRWSYDTGTRVLTVSGSGEMPMKQTGDWPGWGKKGGHKAKKIVIRGNITKIGDNTFWAYHDVTSVELPASLKEIGACAFDDTRSLKKIRLPSGLKKIGAYAFEGSGLKGVELPAGLMRVGNEAFLNCKFRELTIPSGMKKIGSSAFSINSLRKVTISEGVEEIGRFSFSGCGNLSKLRLPDSLKKIGAVSFGSTALRQVTIPKNVETVGGGAFWDCKSLQKVIIRSKRIKSWGKEVFGSEEEDYLPRKDLVIEVPKSKRKQYSKALYEKGLPRYVKVVGKKSLE